MKRCFGAARARQAWVFGVLSALGYVAMAFLSGPELNPKSPDKAHVIAFLVCCGYLFFLYAWLVFPLLGEKRIDDRAFWTIIAFSVLFRLILLPSDLILENDIYRYMWDGHTSHEDVNPFRYAPADAETAPYRTGYWGSVNYPEVPTIYPPTLQAVFYGAEALYPGSLIGMKAIMLLFDLATIAMLMALLAKIGMPRDWALIYACSPLVIKEIANSGHADSVSAFLMVCLIYALASSKEKSGGALAALLAMTKFFGALLLPLLIRRWSWKAYLIFTATMLACYLPFVIDGSNPFVGFYTFSQEWRFNAGLFNLAKHGLIHYAGVSIFNADAVARKLLFGAIVLTVMAQAIGLYRKPTVELHHILRAILISLGTLLMLSPVINPWYLVWMIPLVSAYPSRAWILFTGLVFLSYSYYLERDFPLWIKLIEFGGFFAVLMFDGFVKFNPHETVLLHRKRDGDESAVSQS